MDKIEEFINRRFPSNCDWLEGNCYYFARILKMRFKGEIWYDLVEGHFLFRKGGGVCRGHWGQRLREEHPPKDHHWGAGEDQRRGGGEREDQRPFGAGGRFFHGVYRH